MKRKTSVSIKDEDIELLKDISRVSSKYKGKVSKGIEILLNIFRAIKTERGQDGFPRD